MQSGLRIRTVFPQYSKLDHEATRPILDNGELKAVVPAVLTELLTSRFLRPKHPHLPMAVHQLLPPAVVEPRHHVQDPSPIITGACSEFSVQFRADGDAGSARAFHGFAPVRALREEHLFQIKPLAVFPVEGEGQLPVREGMASFRATQQGVGGFVQQNPTVAPVHRIGERHNDGVLRGQIATTGHALGFASDPELGQGQPLTFFGPNQV